MNDKHKELQQTAIYWLHGRNCDVFANEVPYGEIYDAMGIKYRDSQKDESIIYAIEAKEHGELWMSVEKYSAKLKNLYQFCLLNALPVSLAMF